MGIDLSAGLIPYCSIGVHGTAGANVDVACELRKRLGADKLNLVNVAYDQMPAALAAGTIQLAIGLSAQNQRDKPCAICFICSI